MNNLQIRLATADDASGIFNAHRNSVERLCTQDYSPEQISMWLDGRSAQTYREAIDKGLLWLAETDSIQGFVEVEGNEISKLFICGDGARRGIGSRLLEVAIEHLRNGGAQSAYLEATLTAEPFYARHGFQKIGEGTFSRGNSPVSLEIVKMQRSL
ncbi:GNAT family N-acetyltransferase [Pseudomonas rubra]|uniref:GNAT family N-acetyltransferase n=1 Tax=Pseudomonas rubra TaxID=2942627 RepID=A0ABT5P337_9PSED|nr:GNAT family N-acetyltransferase [Pseudomonas rubra]MDD1012698.1 GNAT family N-acetyltransferase [Pseudomonas rubra]MDD1041594.1 GNAT family N-acetyltransferase [Pseudomonas rubra]MDD1155530.1 GNAT family N-acetyltransferase [Pseudomonas rubra]